jgi:hypothetical protein
MRRRSIPRESVVCTLLFGCAVADGDSTAPSTDAAATTGVESSSVDPPDDDSGPPTDTSGSPEDPTTDASSDSDDPATTAVTTTSTDSSGGDDPAAQLPPTDSAALLPWLEAGTYLAWDRESAIHPSEGPHGGDVRTYVNASLVASLDAGAASHPVDAAVVKELYDGLEVVGYAVMVKVAPGLGGDTWYWYELVGSSTYADGTDVELCWGCHEDGADQVLTPFPLQ